MTAPNPADFLRLPDGTRYVAVDHTNPNEVRQTLRRGDTIVVMMRGQETAVAGVLRSLGSGALSRIELDHSIALDVSYIEGLWLVQRPCLHRKLELRGAVFACIDESTRDCEFTLPR